MTNDAGQEGDYRTVGIDDVWDRLEAGLGQHVAWQALQFGDPRCNRSAFGIRVDDRWVPGENERLRRLLPLIVVGC